jgi:hypothetical protein
MQRFEPSPDKRRSDAAALLIVLAFVVLLSAVVVAYLSRTSIDRQLAEGHYHASRADAIALSALEIVVANFKQEMTDGTPITHANVAPQRNPTPASVSIAPIPNLIRRSVFHESAPAPALASRASNVNSTATSLNGRAITLARWNAHYLVPKANTGDSSADPVITGYAAPNYWAPDWVVVTRSGPESFSAWDNTLRDSTVTNNAFAVGRYAYAVYDEGGLLDANVVGLPSPTPAVTEVGRKGHVAFADLTAMKLTSAGSTPNPATISKMVAWRNYATLQSSGTFAALSPASNPSLFPGYFLDTVRDFRTVAATAYAPTPTASRRTDQCFATRSQLIELFRGNGTAGSTGIGASFNLLQFLGTFSRESNTPTWKAGTAVLQRRFALGQLNLVRPNPAAASIADIKKYFGLKWIAGTPGAVGPPSIPAIPGHWQYVGQGTDLLNSIPPFTSDPDFFQLLNYAMHKTNADDPAHTYMTLSAGAALIDQYDDDTAAEPVTGTTTTMIKYKGGWAFGLENSDPARPAASPLPTASPFPMPGGMSPTPPPAVSGYVMLNRPFRNVGEFGYAFRASTTPTPPPSIPKTIDFVSATSPDAPILDLFTYNTARTRAGIVNLNTQSPAVIAALLKGAITNEVSSATIGHAAANNAASSLAPVPTVGVIASTANGAEGTALKRALGRQEVTRLVTAAANTISSSSEEAKESVARALAEVTQTRTWGLIIDVIAQSGRYPPSARDLADFVVEGEKRYWLHIAIDRFTGEVIDHQLEAVYE